MTKKELDEIKARCAAATPGDWGGFNNPIDEAWAEEYPNDAEFIAHARTDIPRLVAEVERLQAKLDEYISWEWRIMNGW